MTAQTVGKIWIKRKLWEMNIEKRCVIVIELYFMVPRVWKEESNKSGVIEELNTVVTGLKEEIISLKREIKQINIGKNRKLVGLGECFKLQSEEQE